MGTSGIGGSYTRRRLLTTGTMSLLSLILISSKSVEAQTREASLKSIRAAVIQAIGAEEASVEVSVAGKIFSVLRMNSGMNQAGHGARDGEAFRGEYVLLRVQGS
jgi:hypothetical protein